MRRIYIILILILSCTLCACHRNVNTIDEFECVTTAPIIETESQTKGDNYIETEKIYVQDDIKYLMVDISIPDYAILSSYYVYGNMVYYSYSYFDYLSVKGITDVGDGFKAQICVYDIENDTNSIIYTSDKEHVVLDNLYCDGNFLLFWEDITREDVQDEAFYMIDLSQGDVQKINLGTEGKIYSPQIVDNYIIWQSFDEKRENTYVYKYNYLTGETVMFLSVETDNFFTLQNTDRIITICDSQDDGSTNIMAYDLNGNLINTYMVNDFLVSANCNSKCAVWIADEGLMVYDFEKDSIISLELFGFNVLVDDCVIISADDGLYSYKLGTSSQKYLIKSDNNYCAFLSSDIDGKLLAQWYIPGQYNDYPWLENEVTILQILIDSIS